MSVNTTAELYVGYALTKEQVKSLSDEDFAYLMEELEFLHNTDYYREDYSSFIFGVRLGRTNDGIISINPHVDYPTYVKIIWYYEKYFNIKNEAPKHLLARCWL